MKSIVLAISLLAAGAQAQTFVDGGVTINGPLTLLSENGVPVTVVAHDYGPDVTKPDGGLYVWLEIDGHDFLYNPPELYTGSVTLNDDTDCFSTPTAYCAIGVDIGESTLGTINITTPYNLRVSGAIDAGSISVDGIGVCTSCPCGDVADVARLKRPMSTRPPLPVR